MTSNNSVLQGGELVMERGATALELVARRSPESVEALEAYTAALDAWQRDFEAAVKSATNDSAEYVKVATLISEQHDRIVEAAKGLHGELGSSIKNLGGWIKGVRAYTGSLSIQVTTMRPKKG